ncbi:non-ribosomal peptide synthetase [Streptomyces sp. HNM0663]|uniref:Non-ribosomal peptide synthetase n=1 Tax=Streptomyces chengmaiensis TaxID=3040919 RepID=A0ABT6HPD1_9ACTN|nr:non-ribosomal peptide synthetase [Streptomyces chengmaiensis]MDH2390581.1 non-ribosomal peptide synthetase [Streptomyces chengmaiensis]
MPNVPMGLPWPPHGLHELIAAQAARTPRRMAVRCGERSMTYGELLGAVSAVADRLKRHGVGPGHRVAVSIDRSTDLPVALLGVLMAGAAFVPIDPAYPVERQQYMLRASGARITLTVGRLVGREAAGVLLVDGSDSGTSRPEADTLAAQNAGRDGLAYLMYTSGSTGRPKAVAVDHRCLVKGVLSMAPVVGPEPDDVWLSLTSPSFDPVLVDLFLPLVSGASVVIAEDDQVLDGQALRGLLARWEATVLQATPVTWSMLLEAGWSGGLRVALCGGEPMSPFLAARLCARARQVWNIYGPTETTIWSTAHAVTPGDRGVVPVGRPLPDTTLHLLDEERRPVAPGERGEVWIGGGGVTRGYAGEPRLTAERFVADPFSSSGGRLYRTGDMGRLNAEGELELLGRADHQIKIRGHRVEPGEIESRLAEVPSVAEAVVVPRKAGESLRLVAYVRPKKGSLLDEAQLRAHAESRLPRHMLPAVYLTVDEWPRTPNGKIDRRALAELRVPEPSHHPVAPAHTQESAAGPSGSGAHEVVDALAAIWQDVLGASPPSTKADFFALGGTSLDVMRMVKEIRARFGIRLNAVQLMRVAKLDAQSELVADTLAAAESGRSQSQATLKEVVTHAEHR